MFQRLGIVFFLAIGIGGSALADAKWGGIARQIAMGGSNHGTNLILNPFIMEDPALMLQNPAYQAMYKDYAWMNLAGGALAGLSTSPAPYGSPGFYVDDGYGHQNAGIGFALNSAWTVGAIFSYDPSLVNGVSSLISLVTPRAQTIPPVLNVWEGLVSYDAGSLDLGLGVMYGWSNAEVKLAGGSSSEASASLIGFRGGLNYDLGAGSSLDFAAALRLDNATDDISTAGKYTASATEIQVNGRAKMKMSNKVNFVPYGSLLIVSAEPKEDVAPPSGSSGISVDASALVFGLGVGGEYRTTDLYLAGGISYQYAKAKGEFRVGTSSFDTSATYTAMPVVNVGGEWWFTDWLAGRAGYFRSIGSVKIEGKGAAGTNEYTFSFPHSLIAVGAISPYDNDAMLTLGLGLRFGNFSLDATVSETALRRGLGLIGSSDNINTFGYLTGSFNFE